MSKKCISCGNPLNSWGNEVICSICLKKVNTLININTSKRKNDYTLANGLDELIDSVNIFTAALTDDNLDTLKVLLDLIKIVEVCKCISDNMKVDLSLYLEDFYERESKQMV